MGRLQMPLTVFSALSGLVGGYCFRHRFRRRYDEPRPLP